MKTTLLYLATLTSLLTSHIHAQSIADDFNAKILRWPIIYDIAAQNDGSLLVGGIISGINGHAADGLVRIKSDGTADSEFSPVEFHSSHPMMVKTDANGRIFVDRTFGGNFGVLLPNGELDLAFTSPDELDWLRNIWIVGDQYLVHASTYGVGEQLFMINQDGSVDYTFEFGIAEWIDIRDVTV